MSSNTNNNYKIAIIGLGYVGLPLAVEFGKKFETVGFDINQKRIDELREFNDRTLETTSEQLKDAKLLKYTTNLDEIREANIYIVTVPTPVDEHKRPDLTPLFKASESVGKVLKSGDIVIYESTVYPGATEEDCVPILEKFSNLTFNKDFYCGYSPERINPGDKEHTLTKILKVTSGSTPEVAEKVDNLYKSIITAGTYLAPSIKVAESAKVIENAQRDINIAFVNELAMIFNRLNIDTNEVLKAAGTKWNFLNFKPGLVGGHCQTGDEFIFVKSENNGIEVKTFEELNSELETKKEMNYFGTNLKFPKNEVEVMSFDPSNETVNFKKSSVFTKRTYDKLLKIKTSIGKEMKLSDKHPVIVKEADQYNVKFAKDISINDEIPVITTLPVVYKNEKINLIDLFKNSEIANKIRVKIDKNSNDSWKNHKDLVTKSKLDVKVSNFTNLDYLPFELYLKIRDEFIQNNSEDNLILVTGRGNSFSKIKATWKIDTNFARFIGYYLSEGCLSEDQSLRVRITIAKDEFELAQDLTEIIKNFGLSFSVYQDKKTNAQTFKISNRLFGELLRTLKVGKDSYDVSIPDKILFNSDEIRKETLKGLIRGDGGFSLPSKFSYFTSSEKLFQQIILLMHNFDIFPYIRKREGLLEVYLKSDLEKLQEFFLDSKREKIDTALKNKTREHKPQKFYKSDGFFISKVENIQTENVEQNIYSLEVPETSNYITTNGVMTHNCIGIDPYYLAHKAEEVGFHPNIILSGRRINDGMGNYVASQIVKLMIKKSIQIEGSKVLVLGITFKENCPDIRNSRVIDVIQELKEFGCKVDVYDPWADFDEVEHEYKLKLQKNINLDSFDAIVLAVSHNEFKQLDIKTNDKQVIYDVKAFLDEYSGRL